jgi:hypothetical protein
MKSYLVFLVILMSFLSVSISFGQTANQKKKKTAVKTKITKPVEKTESTSVPAIEEKSSFDKFYDRVRIAYFGAYSGTSLGQWDARALDEQGVKDKGYVQNVFNQLAFRYNFGAKMDFVLAPRWMVNLGSTSGYGREGNGVLSLEDMLVGFQGVVVTSEDKKFNWWLRTALRLPTSRASRRRDISYQPDIANNLSYDFDKTWQLGAFITFRHWIFEQRYNAYRYRLYAAPFVQYAIDDTTRIQLWWETYGENRERLKSQNGLKHNFQEYWQDVFVGWNKDITPKLNVFPFVGYLLDTTFGADRPLDATYLGAWVSYQFK